MLGELATRLKQNAGSTILDWNAAPPVDSGSLLRVPGARLRLTPAARPRVRLEVSALDRDWRSRVTFDSEIPEALVPAIEWLQQRKTAFDLQTLGRHLPHIAPADLRQLLELLVKANGLRQLVPR